MCVLASFFFFKQKTAYELRISDWSSDVCSSDLHAQVLQFQVFLDAVLGTFAAQARLLHTAERPDFVRDDAGVDADDAVFQRFRHAPHARVITRVEVSRQAEDGVDRKSTRLNTRT